MLGDFDMKDRAPAVAENDKRVEAFECQRRHGQHVDGGDFAGVIAQKRLPALFASGGARRHVYRDGRLSDIKAKLEQLAMDARCAPQGILVVHAADKGDQLAADPWPTAATAGFPSPPGAKPGAMLARYGFWLHKDEGMARCRHPPAEPDEDGAIRAGQMWRSSAARGDEELVAQQGVFRLQLCGRAKVVRNPRQHQTDGMQ